MNTLWLNGALISRDDARIDPDDRGFLLGDGAFETLRFEAGVIRRWPRHRARLDAALAALEIASPDWRALEAAARSLCEANGLESAVLRLTVSRGASGAGMAPGRPADPTLLLTARALAPAPVSLLARIVEGARRDARNLSSQHKLTGYADMLGARRAARHAGADIALVLSSDGALSSADSANLFWVKGETVFTPALECGCLPGTSRAALIDVLRGEGRAVAEDRFAPEALFEADWAFVTNAVAGVVALSRVDDQAFATPEAAFARLRALCDAAL